MTRLEQLEQDHKDNAAQLLMWFWEKNMRIRGKESRYSDFEIDEMIEQLQKQAVYIDHELDQELARWEQGYE